jgi:predicted TIM-barrel fold metal-dependent hydrolase
VSPFWEEDLNRLANVIGTDHVLVGSDWPHPEGLADPARYVHEIKDMPLQDQACGVQPAGIRR